MTIDNNVYQQLKEIALQHDIVIITAKAPPVETYSTVCPEYANNFIIWDYPDIMRPPQPHPTKK